MNIQVPERLTPLQAINFAKFIGQCDEDDEFVYDFQNMQHCHPNGLLVVAAAIRNNMKRHLDAKHDFINTQNTQGGKFASFFGFFQSIGVDIGDAKEEDEIGYRCIPIKKIYARDLHAQYTDTTLLNAKVNRHAGVLADMLVGDQPKKVRDAIQYCFREIIRNTFEHAETDSLWVCGQYWTSRNEAEIAVLDEGIGILKSLQSNARINAQNCTDANILALQPGLSRTLGMKQDPFDVWQNSGYGLYVASTLCAMNGGYFVLSSGDATVIVNGSEQLQYESSQIGTALCLNIRTDSKKLRDFDHTLSAIVNEGEQKAQQNGEKRILTASKITTIASMIRHIEDAYETDAANNDTKMSMPDDSPIPINTCVTFMPQSSTSHGEVLGVFGYNGQVYNGILLNVSGANRQFYVANHTGISVVVRKLKGEVYVLLEKHKYDKQQENSRRAK